MKKYKLIKTKVIKKLKKGQFSMVNIERKSIKFARKEGLTTKKSKNGIFFYYKHKFDDVRNFKSYISFQEQDSDIKFVLNMIKQDLEQFKYELNSYIKPKEISLKKYYPSEYKRVKLFIRKTKIIKELKVNKK